MMQLIPEYIPGLAAKSMHGIPTIVSPILPFSGKKMSFIYM